MKTLLSPVTWARDFAIIGVVVGAAAPYAVIQDLGFSVSAGLAGSSSGAAVGAVAAWSLNRFRGIVPLVAWVPAMAVLGALWGGFAGACGGLAASFPHNPVEFGSFLGGIGGMLTLGLGFLPYLVLAVRSSTTLPMVVLAAISAPAVGWAGLGVLGAVGAGLWKVALPLLALGAVALAHSERSAKAMRHADPAPRLPPAER